MSNHGTKFKRLYEKVDHVFPMVIWSEFHLRKHKDDDHPMVIIGKTHFTLELFLKLEDFKVLIASLIFQLFRYRRSEDKIRGVAYCTWTRISTIGKQSLNRGQWLVGCSMSSSLIANQQILETSRRLQFGEPRAVSPSPAYHVWDRTGIRKL